MLNIETVIGSPSLRVIAYQYISGQNNGINPDVYNVLSMIF